MARRTSASGDLMKIAGGYDISEVDMPTAILKFDEDGRNESPETTATLLHAIGAGGFSHIFFMSHGWNTDFADAIGQYRRFLKHLEAVEKDRPIPGFKPVFIGASWPSVWFPLDEGPVIAASDGQPDPTRRVVEAVASGAAAEELEALLRQPRLSRAQVERALTLALPALQEVPEDELPVSKPVQLEELVRSVAHLQAEDDPPPIDFTAPPSNVGAGQPKPSEVQIAGGLERLNPKNILRLLSVYKMKDRAGRVGARGVAAVLRDLTDIGPPVHLAGHSFGAKVICSALAAPLPPKRKVKSALLLQPAFSHLAFAETVTGTNRPGGYRKILTAGDRIEKSIFTTYSKADRPLHDLFHLALRRPEDLGEIRLATAAGNPPSKYAALGGYGPRGSGETLKDPIRKPGDNYDDVLGLPLVGLDGSRDIDFPAPRNHARISSHGDVSNPYTAWALLEQMRG